MTSSRKTKTAMIIAIIVLFAVAVSTMGVSYAVWISPDGSIGGGESTASPSVTPTTNNVWAKYFNYNVISDSEKGQKGWSGNIVEITTFYTDSDGVNLSNVYIPNVIWVENGTKKCLQAWMELPRVRTLLIRFIASQTAFLRTQRSKVCP